MKQKEIIDGYIQFLNQTWINKYLYPTPTNKEKLVEDIHELYDQLDIAQPKEILFSSSPANTILLYSVMCHRYETELQENYLSVDDMIMEKLFSVNYVQFGALIDEKLFKEDIAKELQNQLIPFHKNMKEAEHEMAKKINRFYNFILESWQRNIYNISVNGSYAYNKGNLDFEGARYNRNEPDSEYTIKIDYYDKFSPEEILSLNELHKNPALSALFNYRSLMTIGKYNYFHDVYPEIGIKDDKFFDLVDRIVSRHGAFDCIFFPHFVIVTHNPKYIKKNEQDQYHSEDTPAIYWEDGFKKYYFRGNQMRSKWIEEPDTVTREEIFQIENLELRRSLIERLGSERFAKILEVVEIDSDTDTEGNRQVLLRSKEADEAINEYFYFAHVICPSTHREYFLTVPPMDNVWDAVAWTFGKDKNSYKPIIQT